MICLCHRAAWQYELADKPIPDVGLNDALVRIITTICGIDGHILKGEYPVARDLTLGQEPVGVIEKPGSLVEACDLFAPQRDGVLKVAIKPQ